MPNTNEIKPFKKHHRRRRAKTLWMQAFLSLMIVALLFGISYSAVCILHGQSFLPVTGITDEPALSAPESESVPAEPSAPESKPAPAEPPAPESESTPESVPAPAEPPVQPSAPEPVSKESWNIGSPVEQTLNNDITASDSRLLAVPANGRLSREYLRSVLFIGDSLSQGFAIYEPTRDVSKVCAYKSTSPNQVIQNFVGQRPDGSRIEMWDDIKTQSPGTIYILYGTNALVAQSDEAFLKYYSELLDMLRERFAGIPIYVQSIPPTTAAQGVKQPPLQNDHIRLVNNAIAKLARSKGMYYLDAQEALADNDGNLRGDYVGTYDGIHMNPKGYAEWADYILTHTVYSESNLQFLESGPYN